MVASNRGPLGLDVLRQRSNIGARGSRSILADRATTSARKKWLMSCETCKNLIEMFIKIHQRKKGERGKLEIFLTQGWFNGRYPADFAFCYELHLKIYTLLIHRDLLACVVINISHKSTWLWPTESTHPCHYKDYCVACYYQESRELDNQPLFEKWAPLPWGANTGLEGAMEF